MVMPDSQVSDTPNSNAKVSLREVTSDTFRQIIDLKVRPDQEQFVAPNVGSIAEAYFEPKAWFRAIYADEMPVGFVMLYDDEAKPEYFLWRFMIDARYQRHGFGRQALLLVIDHVRTRPGAREFGLSYIPAEGGPEEFYSSLGFVNTGKMIGDEKVMVLQL